MTYQYEWDNFDRLVRIEQIPTTLGTELDILSDTIEFKYDKLGRVTEELTTSGKQSYQYDAIGKLKQLELSDGNRINWLHYGSGHTIGIAYNGKTVSDLERDVLHRETSRAQGTLTQYQAYDTKARKTWQSSINNKIAHSLQRPEEGLLWRQYGYSATDELIASHDALRGTYYYDYDAEGRITGVFNQRAGYQQQQMHYDAADNILNEPVGYWDEKQRKVVEPIHDNRLETYKQLLNRYDAFGNLIERHANGKITYLRYNASNQLIGVRFSQRTQTDEVSYHYNALGRRIKKVNKIDSENSVDIYRECQRNEFHLAWTQIITRGKRRKTTNMVLRPNRGISSDCLCITN